MTAAKPIAIFSNGAVHRERPAFRAACGGEWDAVFGGALEQPAAIFEHFDIEGGAQLPAPDRFAGIVLTGSSAMITQRHPWAEAEADWVRRHRDSVPMLGVCFGHQMLTHALGGEVGWVPSGPQFGTIDVELTDAVLADPLFSGLGRTMKVQVGNSQAALRLPGDATRLADGAGGIMAARFGARTWGLQFHPELTPAMLRALLADYTDHYTANGRIPATELLAGLAETPAAVTVLRRFVALCQGG